jgi:hypothetical protein
MKTLPNLGRANPLRRIPALLLPMTVGLYRAALVEVAGNYLAAGHSLTSVSVALNLPTPTLCRWIHAARKQGAAGLIPNKFRSGRKPKGKPGSKTAPSPKPGDWIEKRPMSGVVTR